MENNTAIPSGWKQKKIADITFKTEQINPTDKPDEEFTYIDVSSVSNNSFKIINTSKIKGKDAPSRARKLVKNQDVIFATVRPTLRRVAVVPNELNNEICSTGFCVLRAKTQEVLPEYLYFSLLTSSFLNRMESIQKGVSYPAVTDGEVKQSLIALPNIDEQSSICYILTTLQKAIQKQKALIATTQALKKSLLHKLFTEGTKGEELKQTEIGLMPKSWDVISLASVYNFTGRPKEVNIAKTSQVPFIPMELVSDQNYYADKYLIKEGSSLSSGTYIEEGDLIVAKITPSFENGKQGIVKFDQFNWGYATTEVIPIKEKVGVSNISYLFYYLQKHDVRKFLAEKMEGSTGRQRLGKTTLKNLLLPFPKDVEEQKEIGRAFRTLDNKINSCTRKAKAHEQLFKTLLHELMTGSIRVQDIEFNTVLSDTLASTEAIPQTIFA